MDYLPLMVTDPARHGQSEKGVTESGGQTKVSPRCGLLRHVPAIRKNGARL